MRSPSFTVIFMVSSAYSNGYIAYVSMSERKSLPDIGSSSYFFKYSTSMNAAHETIMSTSMVLAAFASLLTIMFAVVPFILPVNRCDDRFASLLTDVDGAHVPEIGFMFKRIMSEFNERIDDNAHVNKDMLMDAFNNMMDGYPVGTAVEFALTAI